MAEVYDPHACALGEGPLWHPERGELFWFDILGKTLHSAARSWRFDDHVSAAGWIDRDRLLIASERALFTFDLVTQEQTHLCPLEAENAVTRSNDGRADPQGGFWIGTMGFNAEPGAGAIYRYYRGELRQLFGDITISNAICFAPDGTTAYFVDTPTGQIMQTALDADGWPKGTPKVFVDLSGNDFGPDGAVVDAAGNLWNAQWGAGRVACYGPDGTFQRAVSFPALHTSCPAFGGDDLQTLFCTSATQGLSPQMLDSSAAGGNTQGQTFAAPNVTLGQREHQVIL